jgi:hypothetical protein
VLVFWDPSFPGVLLVERHAWLWRLLCWFSVTYPHRCCGTITWKKKPSGGLLVWDGDIPTLGRVLVISWRNDALSMKVADFQQLTLLLAQIDWHQLWLWSLKSDAMPSVGWIYTPCRVFLRSAWLPAGDSVPAEPSDSRTGSSEAPPKLYGIPVGDFSRSAGAARCRGRTRQVMLVRAHGQGDQRHLNC